MMCIGLKNPDYDADRIKPNNEMHIGLNKPEYDDY